MKPEAVQSLRLAKSAANAVLYQYGHASASAAEAANDREALARAASAAQAFGPPADDCSGDEGDVSDGSSASDSDSPKPARPASAAVVALTEGVAGLGVAGGDTSWPVKGPTKSSDASPHPDACMQTDIRPVTSFAPDS
mmetsp:Transcript_19920/g.58798  ORF Transcript_19920/g.58798 Transcript_19920/m.58798 type:complete len:139 (-) Transcript_19920:173-589(-)